MTTDNDQQIRGVPSTVEHRGHTAVPGSTFIANTRPLPMMSPEEIRQASNGMHEMMGLSNLSQEAVNGYDDPVSLGENAWDIFARSYVRDFDEAARIGISFGLGVQELSSLDRWKDAPFDFSSPIRTAITVMLAARKSINRMSLWEALQAKVGMVVPDTNERIDPRRFRSNKPEWH